MSDENFNERFMKAFKQTGWSVAELSRRSGVTYDVINKLKRRPGSSTSAENAEKLSKALSLDLTEEVDQISTAKALLESLNEARVEQALEYIKFLDGQQRAAENE